MIVMGAETLAVLRERLEQAGARWSCALAERAWSSRILLRMLAAMSDPDAAVARRAAREAFVEGLEDAARAGAIVRRTRPRGLTSRRSLC